MNISRLTTYEAGVLLASATRNVNKLFTSMLKQYGLTGMQWFVLGTIHAAGADGIKLSALSEKLQTGLPFITNTINLLESKGWVERRDSPTDNRSKIVSTAESARSKVNDIEIELQAKMQAITERSIPLEEIFSFISVLERLAKM